MSYNKLYNIKYLERFRFRRTFGVSLRLVIIISYSTDTYKLYSEAKVKKKIYINSHAEWRESLGGDVRWCVREIESIKMHKNMLAWLLCARTDTDLGELVRRAIYTRDVLVCYTMPAHPLLSSVLSMGSAVGSHFVLIKHTNGGGKKNTYFGLPNVLAHIHTIYLYTYARRTRAWAYYYIRTHTRTPTSCKTDACTLVVRGFWLSLRTPSWRPFRVGENG